MILQELLSNMCFPMVSLQKLWQPLGTGRKQNKTKSLSPKPEIWESFPSDYWDFFYLECFSPPIFCKIHTIHGSHFHSWESSLNIIQTGEGWDTILYTREWIRNIRKYSGCKTLENPVMLPSNQGKDKTQCQPTYCLNFINNFPSICWGWVPGHSLDTMNSIPCTAKTKITN